MHMPDGLAFDVTFNEDKSVAWLKLDVILFALVDVKVDWNSKFIQLV